MEKEYRFEVKEIKKIQLEEYPDDEFCVAKMDFLGSNPNSHNLHISNEVFRECAHTVLGKFLVADIIFNDCGTHSSKENIKGYVPKNQEVEFVDTEDGYVRGLVDVVISKQYASDFVSLFTEGKQKSVSVEMKCVTPENSNEVESFRIFGVTVLGDTVKPSSPGSTIEFTRFSEEDAMTFFDKLHPHNRDGLQALKTFAIERKKNMAEKYVSHPIDTSKEAMYDGEWDGNQAKQDLVKEKNYESLAPKVCLRLEDGWKDREVTKLGYPVMMLHEGKWVYSRRALESAKSYAEQNNEEEVLSELKRIYKTLGLEWEKSGKEEKMAKEVEFAAVNIGDMWSKLWEIIRKRTDWEYCIEGIYEEDNKKFAVLTDRSGDLYRLDFSLTEDGMAVADEVVGVKKEFIETDELKKFAEPEDAEKFKKFEDDEDEPDDEGDDDDKDVEMSADEMKAEMARLQADIESRDNIIMEKDTELADLRAFKQACMEADRAKTVDGVMAQYAKFMDKAEADKCRNEGLLTNFAEIDAWANRVKASVVDKVIKPEKNVEFTRIGAPIVNIEKSGSVWDRI